MRREDSAILLDIAHAARLVGEAANRLSSEFRTRYPEVPWSNMAGMRDKLIHAYEVVDYDEVWRTATKDVPELLAWVTPRLPDEPPLPRV